MVHPVSRIRGGGLTEQPVRLDVGRTNRLCGLGRNKRSTCGLRISDSPTSDNLIPQETTNQDAPEMGADGGELSYPGSSAVARIDYAGQRGSQWVLFLSPR